MDFTQIGATLRNNLFNGFDFNRFFVDVAEK